MFLVETVRSGFFVVVVFSSCCIWLEFDDDWRIVLKITVYENHKTVVSGLLFHSGVGVLTPESMQTSDLTPRILADRVNFS